MRRRPTALLAAFALVACTRDRAEPHLARGNVLVNNGHAEEALAEYRVAARLAPRSRLPLERLGDTLYDLGRKDEALTAYREASAREPDEPTARIGAARVLADQGRLAEARAELTEALFNSPTNLYTLLSRGNLALRAGDRKAALADYERAVHLKSKNVPALYQYGLALLADGQIEEAARTFDRLVSVAPDAPEGYYGRARVLADRGEATRAASALGEARRRIEQDARARLAEQGLRGDALERKVAETTQRSLASMRDEPAFARFAKDPEFRRAAGLDPPNASTAR